MAGDVDGANGRSPGSGSLSVLTQVQNRGVKDFFIACVDGLTGLPEAVEAVSPREPGAVLHGASGESTRSRM